MTFVENPPDAVSLMTTARSFGNYDLPGALADLIDNSIKARARIVRLTCSYNGGDPAIRVLDDGEGMDADELRRAMRPASADPLSERSPDDLGRFGWGLKSASFSQCKKLTVLSRRAGELSGAGWDLDDVSGWRMAVFSPAEVEVLASPELLARDGTEIIWSKCDRLSEEGTLTSSEFNALIVHTRNRIALVFHRYLAGEVRRRPLAIVLNGAPIEGWDPFHRDHDATQKLEEETLEIGGSRIVIQPYVLPHYAKLKSREFDRLAGEEGLLRNQGFYVYRNGRLIISGTWFRLIRHGELSQLVRVSVEIPNALDHIWKITIDKADAQLPALLRSRLKQIVDGLRRRSAKVYRSRGGRLDRTCNISVWSRYARGGEIQYSINREHPLIEALLKGGDEQQKGTALAALNVIEQAFPVTAFGEDASVRLADIHQTATNPAQFQQDLLTALPALLDQADGSMDGLIELLKVTEPFCESWGAVEELLIEKGWIHAES